MQLARQVQLVLKVRLVLASLSTDNTLTMQHLLLHSQQGNLVMAISPRTEAFGYGVLKTTTGTTLVTLKVQQDQQVQQASLAQQVLPVSKAQQVQLDLKVFKERLVQLVQLALLAQPVHKVQQDHKVFKETLALQEQQAHKALPVLQVQLAQREQLVLQVSL